MSFFIGVKRVRQNRANEISIAYEILLIKEDNKNISSLFRINEKLLDEKQRANINWFCAINLNQD